MTSPVLFERIGTVALLTLNRPEKLNALNFAVNDLLLRHVAEIESDPTVRAVILTGAGDRAFSAGADIPEFSQCIERSPEAALKEFVQRGQATTSSLENCSKPVIAAVGGIAYGGGCEITEAAHLAIASEQATFAKPEISIGIPPTFGGTQRLPRLAGRKRALQWLLTGEAFDARTACEIGVVNRVVKHEHLLDEALLLANRIAEFAPGTVAAILKAVSSGLDRPMASGLEAEQAAFAAVAGSEDTKIALGRWLDRST